MKYIKLPFTLFLCFGFNAQAQEYDRVEFICLNETNTKSNQSVTDNSVEDKSVKAHLLRELYIPINVYIGGDVMSPFFIEESLINAQESFFYFLSSGKSGELLIEGQWKNVEQIVHWFEENEILQKQKQLNIYGCEFAKNKKEKFVVKYLETTLGIPVAASNDTIGVDRDWDLEIGQANGQLDCSEYNYNLQACTAGTFIWEDEAGSNFPTNSTNRFVDLTVTSGTAYTVDWENIVGIDDPKDQTGLGAGTYISTVTTVDTCVTIDTITLVAPLRHVCSLQ